MEIVLYDLHLSLGIICDKTVSKAERPKGGEGSDAVWFGEEKARGSACSDAGMKCWAEWR